MSYSKTTWVSGTAPGISAANLNNLETQHEKALIDMFTVQSAVGGSRAFTTVYQNTGTKPMLVLITGSISAAAGTVTVSALCSPDANPIVLVGMTNAIPVGQAGNFSFTFLVLPGYYYKLIKSAESSAIHTWIEYT